MKNIPPTGSKGVQNSIIYVRIFFNFRNKTVGGNAGGYTGRNPEHDDYL